MRRYCGHRRQLLGMLLALMGVLIVFICLPKQFFLIVLGTMMAAAGIALLR